jgi:hypothetical protein
MRHYLTPSIQRTEHKDFSILLVGSIHLIAGVNSSQSHFAYNSVKLAFQWCLAATKMFFLQNEFSLVCPDKKFHVSMKFSVDITLQWIAPVTNWSYDESICDESTLAINQPSDESTRNELTCNKSYCNDSY